MSENPFEKKVHVVVNPCFDTYDAEGEYYISLQMSPLELQLSGERFVSAARKAVHRVLLGGKIAVHNDNIGSQPSAPGASQRFMHHMVSPEEIEITPVWRHVTHEGKPLTDFGIDTTISPTNI